VALGDKIDLRQVERFASAGLTLNQIALTLGVSERTIRRWRVNPEWLAAENRGKSSAKAIVEASLFQKATGYFVEELEWERVEVIRKKRGKSTPGQAEGGEGGRGTKPVYDTATELVLMKKRKKHYAPDTLAIMYYLNNKDPDTWKNRTDLDARITGKKVEVLELRGATVADLKQLNARIAEAKARRLGGASFTGSDGVTKAADVIEGGDKVSTTPEGDKVGS